MPMICIIQRFDLRWAYWQHFRKRLPVKTDFYHYTRLNKINTDLMVHAIHIKDNAGTLLTTCIRKAEGYVNICVLIVDPSATLADQLLLVLKWILV